MGTFGAVFMLFNIVISVVVAIFLLVLLAKFVNAHQRGADALETIARKLPAAGEGR